jgi:hypothetical protein
LVGVGGAGSGKNQSVFRVNFAKDGRRNRRSRGSG